MIDIKKDLKKACPFTQAFDDKGEDGRPKSEVGYFRCDNDGYKWWSTAWHINEDLETPELVEEFDGLCEAFFEAFPTLNSMAAFCQREFDPMSDPTEFNAYLELDHGCYWFRMITRPRDYNLYLYCYSKDYIEEKGR